LPLPIVKAEITPERVSTTGEEDAAEYAAVEISLLLQLKQKLLQMKVSLKPMKISFFCWF
jgi:hypothetical protein